MRYLLTILFAVLLAGCVSKSPQFVRTSPPMPPMPQGYVRSIVQDAPEASTVPWEPPRLMLEWEPSTDPVLWYNIYAAPIPSLSAMQKVGTSTTTNWPFVADLPERYFQVKAMGVHGVESGWAEDRK